MSEWQRLAHLRRSEIIRTAVQWREAILKKDPKAPELQKEHEAAIDKYRKGR